MKLSQESVLVRHRTSKKKKLGRQQGSQVRERKEPKLGSCVCQKVRVFYTPSSLDGWPCAGWSKRRLDCYCSCCCSELGRFIRIYYLEKRLQVVSVRACFNKGGRNQLAQSVPYHILRQYFEVEVRTFVRYPQIVVALLLRQSPLCMAFLCVELKR